MSNTEPPVFAKGSLIKIRAGANSLFHTLPPTRLTGLVLDPDPHHPTKVAANVTYPDGKVRRRVLDPKDVILVGRVVSPEMPEPDSLDPSKVKAGDYIEAESEGTGVKGTVSHITERGFVAIEHLGEFRIQGITEATHGYRMFVLTDHQPAPEPEPEWKPGTVAVIEVDGDHTYRAIRNDGGQWDAENAWTYGDSEVTDVRPLVVIDPENARAKVAETIKGQYEYWIDEDHNRAEFLEGVTIEVLSTLGIEAP